MKTKTKCDMCRVTSDKTMAATRKTGSRHVSRVTCHVSAFTLIELLVVITIIAVLAAFSIPVVGAVKKTAILNRTKGEMAQIEAALDRYKAAYGTYPPGNPNANAASLSLSLTNQLFYELEGTTLSGGIFTNLDRNISIAAGTVTNAFGVGGFLNCTKGGGEDAVSARNFLPELNSDRKAVITVGGSSVTVLIASVGGPLSTYQPGGLPSGVNPWRYVCPGVNNPNSYDLWVQLVINPGKTNLICNWSSQVQINSPQP